MVDAVVKTPEFLPFTSVGIFRFGADITEYKNILETFMYEPPDEFGTEYYESPDSNLLISVKKNKIISIFCYQELYFMGVNIIGLNFEDFKQLSITLNHTVLINIIYQMNLIRHMSMSLMK
ncbi:Uncharacterised protein [Neisseria gonorrhoeae]|uniref:Uncharacterized protein n=1 Tax=Neisseria gonorrhoeae TaxID=485 RepID=A0A378VW80_NEIGO|nr:Uncharacterised protein [Neisseria gonorrhoeae]